MNLPAYDGSFRARAAHADYLRGVALPTRRDTLLPGPRPTARQLERHAEKFGPEGVAETAAELGISVTVARPVRVAGPRRPSLKSRVKALVEAGHSAETIAEIEDLTPQRARRLVEEVG